MLTRRRERGQSLVEFSLILLPLLLALFGTIDGARLIYTNNQLSQAAREGARVAAVEARWIGITTLTDPSCVSAESQITAANPGAHVCPATPAALKADVVAAANRMAVALNAITDTEVYFACDAGAALGDPAPTGAWTEATVSFPDCAGSSAPNSAGALVSVRIVYTFIPITPIAGSAIGSVALSGSATMVIQ